MMPSLMKSINFSAISKSAVKRIHPANHLSHFSPSISLPLLTVQAHARVRFIPFRNGQGSVHLEEEARKTIEKSPCPDSQNDSRVPQYFPHLRPLLHGHLRPTPLAQIAAGSFNPLGVVCRLFDAEEIVGGPIEEPAQTERDDPLHVQQFSFHLSQPLDKFDDLLIVSPSCEDMRDETGVIAGPAANVVNAKPGHDDLCPKGPEVALSISRPAFVGRPSNKSKMSTRKFEKSKFVIDAAQVGKRLKQLRDLLNLTIKEFSKETGLSLGLISEAESGKNKPSPNLLFALAKKYHVDTNWLLTGEGDHFVQPKKSIESSDFQLVPVIGVAACGGSGRILEKDIEGYKAFEMAFVSKFKNPVLTRARGDSMLPVIANGDLLLCDRDPGKRMRPDTKHLYLINNPEKVDDVAITVKKLNLSGSLLTLIPLNTDYLPYSIDITSRSILDIVLGRIAWIGRELSS